ncbi:MAG TPA: LCP family protein [Anaerolineales bacterium]|nr:LCP family protein [Anaerolineales bacterium]
MKRTGWLRWIAVIGFVLLIGASGTYSFSTARHFALTSPFEGLAGFAPADSEATPRPESGDEESGETEENGGAVPEVSGDEIPESGWEGADRVTILVMGLDYRDWEAGTDAPRTDTMILLTVDPVSRTAGMLSIPRDLYVNIPGFDPDRINTAYRFGEIYDLPGGGPGLAVETVEQLVGVSIDYYAQVDFDVFVRMIDEIGGVKLDVPSEITVDLIGPEPPKTLKPGVQTLSGEVALAYARARNTPGGDFDRAARQQQVILAIRDRILSFDLIPILLTKAGVLYDELASGVKTDMSLETAIDLGLLVYSIPEENIRRGQIGESEIIFYTTADGDQVLKPIPDRIRTVRDEIFGTAGLTSPLAGLTAEERAAAENANIQILNGTFRDGLASSTLDYLNGLGFTIPAENAGSTEDKTVYTQIFDYTGNPYTVQRLVELLNIQQHLIFLRYDPENAVDVMVSLGDDWAGQLGP